MKNEIKKNIILCLILVSVCFIVINKLAGGQIDGFHYKYVIINIIVNFLIVMGSKLCCSQKMYWGTFCAIEILLFSVLFLKAISSADIMWVNLVRTVNFNICLGGLAILLTNLVQDKLLRIFVATILWGPIFLVVGLFWLYYFSENAWLGYDAILAIMQTNLSETSSYLHTHMCVSMLGAIVIVFCIIFGMYREVYFKGGIFLNGKLRVILLVVLLISGLLVDHVFKKIILWSHFITHIKDKKNIINFDLQSYTGI